MKTKCDQCKALEELNAELLSALVNLYTKFKGEGLGKDKWYGPIMDRAKEVIAKAAKAKEEPL